MMRFGYHGVMTRRLLVASVGLFAGCLFPTLDGLTGGGDATTNDAGETGAGDAASDTPADVSPFDAPPDVAPDVQPPGDAGADGDADAGTHACTDAGVIFCEDFEQPLTAVWNTSGSGGPGVRDTTRSHSGTTSLHLATNAINNVGGSYSVGIAETQTFANTALATGFYARAWIYVPSTSTFANGMAFFGVQQAVSPWQGTDVQITTANKVSLVNYTGSGGYAETTTALVRDVWDCVEWHMVYGLTNGSVTLWISGTPAASLSNVSTQPSPPYGSLFVEAAFYQVSVAQPAVEIWVDDVIVDSQPIGCLK